MIKSLQISKFVKKANKEIVKNIDVTIKNILKAEKMLKQLCLASNFKNAQPVSFAHYLMVYLEMFNRDKNRFKNNLDSLNESPLGVAALTGTLKLIDFILQKIRLFRPTKNSIDTVSDRDFVIDFLYSCSACAVHISRIAEEFIIWNSDAFKLIN